MNLLRKSNQRGFTLIELLIVVAIIAILAAIAIPNFLAAQIRAKVSRSKGDLRSVAIGMESYNVDFNQFPYVANTTGHFLFLEFTPSAGDPCPLYEITTPIAYITSVPHDQFAYTYGGSFDYPFRYSPFAENGTAPYDHINYKYHGGYVLGSAGPSRTFNPIYSDIVNAYDGGGIGTVPGSRVVDLYDPTNGTVSPGNLTRSQGGSTQNL